MNTEQQNYQSVFENENSVEKRSTTLTLPKNRDANQASVMGNTSQQATSVDQYHNPAITQAKVKPRGRHQPEQPAKLANTNSLAGTAGFTQHSLSQEQFSNSFQSSYPNYVRETNDADFQQENQEFDYANPMVYSDIEQASTAPIEEVTPPVLRYVAKSNQSYAIAQASVGISHLNNKTQIPCQDSVIATVSSRSILIACDGAGSSTMSDVGSSALCVQLTRFCRSIEPILGTWLDVVKPSQDNELLVKMIIRQAIGILKDLSEQHRRDIKDFRSTLNLALLGTERILWVKIGDGEIIQESIYYDENQENGLNYHLACIGQHAKGEFANQTQFIDDTLQFSDVQWGILDREKTHGLVLMSDGASEKLVSHDRVKISGQINQWLMQLREQKLKAGDIAKRFYSDEFNHRSTGDDRSIVLWAESIITS